MMKSDNTNVLIIIATVLFLVIMIFTAAQKVSFEREWRTAVSDFATVATEGINKNHAAIENVKADVTASKAEVKKLDERVSSIPTETHVTYAYQGDAYCVADQGANGSISLDCRPFKR